MNPRAQRFAERLSQLIEEGHGVARLEAPSSVPHVPPYIHERVKLHSWLVKVENAVAATFGTQSVHYNRLRSQLDDNPSRASEVKRIIGILDGALDDLLGGYLLGQEQMIAGDLLDGVLAQARVLLAGGFKDPAAVLARVVVEDALRRLARARGLADDGKASAINDALLKVACYPKPRWRQIQAWLDLGNAAAHGDLSAVTVPEVQAMLDSLQGFIADALSP